MTDDELADAIILEEGGFVNDPDDRGGATRWGITKATLEDYRHQPVSDDDVANLSITEARSILKQEYIYKPSYHLLGSEVLRAELVDFAVHSGPARATKALQKVLGLSQDGIVGGQTIHAANIRPGLTLAVKVLAERFRYLADVVADDPKQVKFIRGWANRIAGRLEALDV